MLSFGDDTVLYVREDTWERAKLIVKKQNKKCMKIWLDINLLVVCFNKIYLIFYQMCIWSAIR